MDELFRPLLDLYKDDNTSVFRELHYNIAEEMLHGFEKVCEYK